MRQPDMTVTHNLQSEAKDFPQDAKVRNLHFYRAYGLTISSEVALPELEPTAPADADLSIRIRPIDMPKPAVPGGTAFEFGPDRQYLAWETVGAFLITDARHIDIEPAPDVGDGLIAFPLLGPVMALLLHQRGMFILHASAIAVGGGSAVFLGDKGAGKSTTAGAMIAAGHKLLTDDVLAIAVDGPEGPQIAPGFPQLKLADDAAAAFTVEGAEVRPQVHPAIEKRQHRLSAGFSEERVPPSRIYVLERGEKAAISPLPAGEALAALIKFSYVTRFHRSAMPGMAAADHLRQCARLAGEIGVCRLEVPTGLDRIAEAVKLVESDVIASGRK